MTALPNVPILPEIVRQHAEMAAFLWTVYDRALLYPDENLEMDATALADLVGRLEAHLDGLRIAGADGVRNGSRNSPDRASCSSSGYCSPGLKTLRWRNWIWTESEPFCARTLQVTREDARWQVTLAIALPVPKCPNFLRRALEGVVLPFCNRRL
jgi:hypothetical protein